MEQRKKSKVSLLFLMALAPCLCFAQAKNEGILYVKSGTVLSIMGTFENATTADLTNNGDLYVYNDFTNNGTVDFTPGETSGKTWFQSKKLSNLNILGTGTSKFNNVEFNIIDASAPATAGFSLGNKLSVSGVADFKKGIITYSTGSDLLTFENDATANANNDSFVKAAVVKNGNKAFTYPVGDGAKYRPVSISAPSDAGAVFKGQYFKNNPGNLHPLDKIDLSSSSLSFIDDVEYWEIKRTDAGTGNVFVTLKWDEAITPSKIIGELSDNIHVVRWDDAKNLWVDEGGVVDLSKKEVTTISQSLGNYGIFTLAKTNDNKDVVLPNAGLSPNNDGLNDELIIPGLGTHPGNKVTVFDRLGKVLFDTTNYNTNGNVFKGYLSNGDVLPLGTYFYTVDYRDESTGRRVRKSNYLYINLR